MPARRRTEAEHSQPSPSQRATGHRRPAGYGLFRAAMNVYGLRMFVDHVVHNKVEAAYARSDLFERRQRLMDDWKAYLG